MTLSHARGSLASSSSPSSWTPRLDMPKLVLLSSLVGPSGLNPNLVFTTSLVPVSESMLSVLDNPLVGPITFPPLILPSKVLRISCSSLLEPSTMTPPLRFFQLLAISSRTFSAKPSSRHPEPQCLPMKEASSCSAEEVSVKECFFVKVRKASGLNVAGGSMMGRIAAFGALTLKGLSGCAGVPKAGDDEGMADEGGPGGCCFRKMGAGVLSILAMLMKQVRHHQTRQKILILSVRSPALQCAMPCNWTLGWWDGPRRRV